VTFLGDEQMPDLQIQMILPRIHVFFRIPNQNRSNLRYKMQSRRPASENHNFPRKPQKREIEKKSGEKINRIDNISQNATDENAKRT
jgi:hypothetical protein